jgi:endogenous inhibitor of DNA gyrase (YacG/DUF329 family)
MSRSKCPICKTKKPNEKFFPFCSERCSSVDLGKWLNESYLIENEANDESENNEIIENNTDY